MIEIFNSNIYNFGSSSALHLIVQYNKRRSGADMQYQFYYRLYVADRNGNPNPYGYYNNNLKLTFTLNNGIVWQPETGGHSSSGWSVENTSGWVTVSNKTTGTTPLVVKVDDQQNASWCHYTSGTFNLAVDPAGSDLGSISNFNLGSNFSVTITKYASMYDVLTIKYNSNTIKTINNVSTNSYNFTSTELNTIYGYIPSSKEITLTFELRTYSDSSKSTQVGTTKSTTAKGYVVNSNPTINSVTIVDTNSTTKTLTGSTSSPYIVVSGQSNIVVTVSASGVNRASISSITINNVTASSGVVTFNNCNTDRFDITVIDSRGNVTSTTRTTTIVWYRDLSCEANFYRQTQTSSTVLLSYSGNYWSGNFGATNNTLTLSWAYRIKGASSWTNGGTLTPTIDTSKNTYSGSINCGSIFDYQTNYEFIVYYKDKIYTNQNTGIINLTRGVGSLEVYSNAVKINGDLILNEQLIINTSISFSRGETIKSISYYLPNNYKANEIRVLSSSYNYNPDSLVGGSVRIYSPNLAVAVTSSGSLSTDNDYLYITFDNSTGNALTVYIEIIIYKIKNI